VMWAGGVGVGVGPEAKRGVGHPQQRGGGGGRDEHALSLSMLSVCSGPPHPKHTQPRISPYNFIYEH